MNISLHRRCFSLMIVVLLGLVLLAAARPADRPKPGRRLAPRTAVLLVLGAIVVIGVGRKWLEGHRARLAIERLHGQQPTLADIETAPQHGRAVLFDLFRLQTEASSPEQRSAAGAALARLWAADQLVFEEEKAIVTRGFEVRWIARRRYPRDLTLTIPIRVHFGLFFLSASGATIRPEQVLWRYRVEGSRRASLETMSDWYPGPIRLTVPIEPSDFPGTGPHQLVLEAMARTEGLSSSWEHALPHVPFSFEFDSRLRPEALFALPDVGTSDAMTRCLKLDAPASPAQTPRYLALGNGLSLSNPPVLSLVEPAPCDLAHRMVLEFEGVASPWSMRPVVLNLASVVPPLMLPLQPDPLAAAAPIDRTGRYRVRARLEPDPQLGWTEPDIRSVWPNRIETDWYEVEVIRA